MRDFTLKKYTQLLSILGNGDFTTKNHFSNGSNIILRHDIDRPPHNVIPMARLEHHNGIKSTYFFRVRPRLFKPEIISKVMSLGHEIGYHYEVLDKARGDYQKAIQIFENEWKLFKTWNSVSICMHGNPLSSYVNKDIWGKYNFRDFNVLGEAYISIDFHKMKYFTDTGRKWNSKHFSVKDKISNNLIEIKSTNKLIKFIKENQMKGFYILTHPSKWNDSLLPWCWELIYQNSKNIVKSMINKIKNS